MKTTFHSLDNENRNKKYTIDIVPEFIFVGQYVFYVLAEGEQWELFYLNKSLCSIDYASFNIHFIYFCNEKDFKT